VKLLLAGDGDSGKLQKRGSDGGGFGRRRGPAPLKSAPGRRFDDERDVDGGVVDKESMFVLAVFPERFAMVAEHHDGAAIIEARGFEPGDESAQFVIGISDLAVVRMSFVLGAEGLGRIIGAVGIVEMEPEENGLGPMVLEPLDGAINALTGAAVHQSGVFCGEGFGGKSVVIEIETAGETPGAIKDESADHGAGRVAMLPEGLRHGAEVGIERLSGEILHTVLERIGAGKNDGVRWPGERYLGDGAIEPDAIEGQGVQGGRGGGRFAVAADVIGANCINGDQYDIRGSFAGRRVCGK